MTVFFDFVLDRRKPVENSNQRFPILSLYASVLLSRTFEISSNWIKEQNDGIHGNRLEEAKTGWNSMGNAAHSTSRTVS